MKPLFRSPILFFALIFSALIAVQAYYLWNTAQLWKSEIYRNVHNKLDEIGVDSDERLKNIDDAFAELITKFDDGKISKNIFLEKAKILQKGANTNLSNKIDSTFRADGYTVGVEKELISIFSEQRKKMIIHKPLILLKSKNYFAEEKLLSTGRWGTEFKHRNTNNPADDRAYKFIINTKMNFGVQNINSILFKKLAPQILLNILLCGLMLYLFSKTLKNLNLQNQKISQLHTTIDAITHELNTPLTTLKFALKNQTSAQENPLIARQIQKIEEIISEIHQNPENSVPLSEAMLDAYFEKIKADFPSINFIFSKNFTQNKTLTETDF